MIKSELFGCVADLIYGVCVTKLAFSVPCCLVSRLMTTVQVVFL